MHRTSALVCTLLAVAGCRTARPPVVELWLAGDVHLGEARAATLAPLVPVLRGAAGVVNLEGPVGPGAAQSAEGRLVNAPETAAVLARAGVRVAGMANNHAGDLGAQGTADTLRALEGQGILPADGARVAVLTQGGLRVAVTAHDLSHGMPPGLAQELRGARARADVLVATFHVLAPPSLLPAPELREAAEVALQAGASVVAAHGSHALARVERRGRMLVAWGLGNLAFACACTDREEGLVLRVALDAGGLRHAEAIPVDAGLRGAPARPAADPALTLQLLRALESSPFEVRDGRAVF